jgi:hypothetical protein
MNRSNLRPLKSAFAIGALCCAIAGGSGATATAAAAAAIAPAKAAKELHEAAPRAHVYLMRGLMNIFSLGMDQLAAAIAGHGIDASVNNHAEADAVISRIAANYRADHGPIILIGHSLGADAVMLMAQSLDRMGIPVALVVPFDGTASYSAPKNVACVLNLTQREFAYMRAGAGFHGKLSNVDLRGKAGIDHFTIDKSPQLQAQALKAVLDAATGHACQPDIGNAAAAKPKDGRPPHAASPQRLGLEASQSSPYLR